VFADGFADRFVERLQRMRCQCGQNLGLDNGIKLGGADREAVGFGTVPA
jgi:hypothetical protein